MCVGVLFFSFSGEYISIATKCIYVTLAYRYLFWHLAYLSDGWPFEMCVPTTWNGTVCSAAKHCFIADLSDSNTQQVAWDDSAESKAGVRLSIIGFMQPQLGLWLHRNTYWQEAKCHCSQCLCLCVWDRPLFKPVISFQTYKLQNSPLDEDNASRFLWCFMDINHCHNNSNQCASQQNSLLCYLIYSVSNPYFWLCGLW